MYLPRVLIIGQPFNNNTGGGITQSNLFRGWDKDKIAVVCTSHMFNNLNTELCTTYYLLGNLEYKWIFPLNLIQRKILSGSLLIKNQTAENKSTGSAKIPIRTRLINNYLYPFLEYIGLFHCSSKIKLSEKLCKWVDEYKPDVIYAQAPTRETVLFCTLMEDYIKKPLIYHVMDDWPSTISEKGPFKNYWKKKIDTELRILLNKATVLLSISEAMAEEYQARYDRRFITFHNPIEIDFWKKYQRKNYQLSSSPNILYAGRIGTGIQTTLEVMAQAIDKVNEHLKYPVKFILQTGDKPSWVDNYKCVQHKPLVAYSELPKVFAEADLLYLPYDFSIESIKFIKYSMPTKAPEYMVSGTPIIVFAPVDTAIVKDAQLGNWAKVITQNDIDILCQAINVLIANEDLRKQIATNATRIAETKYNAVIIRDQFKQIVISTAS